MIGHRMMMKKKSSGIPYIMPDGDSYWDSGFIGGTNCEYLVDAYWKSFPRNPNNDGERVLLGASIWQTNSVCPCTFNWYALKQDSVTTQASQTEVRNANIQDFLGVRSLLRIKHKCGDNYLRIGFDGGVEATTYMSKSISGQVSVWICNARTGQFAAVPIPADTVMIFSITMKRDGVTEMNFVPFVDNGTPCFLETVSNSVVHSIGTTNGVYGIFQN